MTGVEIVGAVTAVGGAGLPLFGSAGLFQFQPLLGVNTHAACLQAAGHSGNARFVAEKEYFLRVVYTRRGVFGGNTKDLPTKLINTFDTIRGKRVAKIRIPLEIGFTHGHYVDDDEKVIPTVTKSDQPLMGIDNCYVLLNGKIYNALNESGSLSFVAITRDIADPILVIQWCASLNGRGVLSQQHAQRTGQIYIRARDRRISVDKPPQGKEKSYTMKYFDGLENYDQGIQVI
jgi:hypothetical protein